MLPSVSNRVLHSVGTCLRQASRRVQPTVERALSANTPLNQIATIGEKRNISTNSHIGDVQTNAHPREDTQSSMKVELGKYCDSSPENDVFSVLKVYGRYTSMLWNKGGLNAKNEAK